MVEKVTLPADPSPLRRNFLEFAHNLTHLLLSREGYKGMQVIGHQQQLMHIPAPKAMSEIHRLENHGGNVIPAQLIEAT